MTTADAMLIYRFTKSRAQVGLDLDSWADLRFKYSTITNEFVSSFFSVQSAVRIFTIHTH